MVLRAKQIFDKNYMIQGRPSDFVDYLAHKIEAELVDKLMITLEDHKLYIVQLSEPESVDHPKTMEVEYRQDLNCIEIVQCKNCRMHFPWCHKFKSELGGNGFCLYGKEIENA